MNALLRYSFLKFMAALVVGALVLSVISTRAGVISQDLSNGSSWNLSYFQTAQTFTAEDARISIAAVYMENSFFQMEARVQALIRSGSGFSGEIIATAEATLPIGYKGYLPFDFSSALLVPGSKYTLELQPAPGNTGNEVMLQRSDSDAYAGGELLLNGGIWAVDLRFRIIPEGARVSSVAISPRLLEVAEESGTATLNLTRSGDNGVTAQVSYLTSKPDGSTAVEGLHYTGGTGTATFAPGETQKAITITILNDETFESNRVFMVEVSPANAETLIDAGSSTITILDDDAIYVTFPTNMFGFPVKELSGAVQIPVQRSGKLHLTVGASFHFADGSAVNGQDYLGVDGQLQFGPGETLKYIPAQILQDALMEDMEGFRIDLEPTGGASTPQKHMFVNIEDTSARVEFATTHTNMVEGNWTISLLLQRMGNPGSDLSFSFETVNDTAIAGLDYVATTGQITFAPSENSKTISIPILNDFAEEGSERFHVRLFSSAPQVFLGFGPQATVTIVNNSVVIGFASTNLIVSEAGGTARLAVRRSGLLDIPASVLYMTTPGTAAPGGDFAAQSGQIDFAAGETEKIIEIALINDVLPELSERFGVTLTGASGNLRLTNNNATIEIRDDSAIIEFASTNIVVFETGAEAEIQVWRHGNVNQSFTVEFITENGRAQSGTHFTATSGILAFAPGETNKTIVIPILNNALSEGDLEFSVRLQTAAGEVRIGDWQRARILIGDDEQVVNFSSAQYAGYQSSGSVQLVLTRGPGQLAPLRVRYSTADGTALAGTDYVATDAFVEFAAGQSNATITVPLVRDHAAGLGRSFSVQLSDPAGGSVGPSGAAEIIITGSGILAFDHYFMPELTAADFAIQPSEKILIMDYQQIARLNQDGSRDLSYAGVSGSFSSRIAMQSDGRLLYLDISEPRRLRRLTVNGAIDPSFTETSISTWWPILLGANDEIFTIIIHPEFLN